MFFLCLGTLAGLVLAIIVAWDEHEFEETKDKVVSALQYMPLLGFLGFLIGCLMAVIGGGIISIFFRGNLIEKQVSNTALYSLYDDPTINGRFFLGSGAIDGELTYFYNVENADGSYTPKQLNVANNPVRVFEEEIEEAYLIVYASYCGTWACHWFSLGLEEFARYEFHVPDGTLDRSYILH